MERPRAKLLWDWGEIRAMRRWGQAPAAVGTGPAGERVLRAAFEVDAEGADAGGRVGERWIAVVGDERVGSGDGNAGILLVLRRD